MEEFESPTYVLDLGKRVTRERIENAKPLVVINVLVCDANDVLAKSVQAQGLLTERGEFVVTVRTGDGIQQHDWLYADLLDAVRTAREK